jgi:deazaflavin-dependent oxidoreductase (nitroreductase family)
MTDAKVPATLPDWVKNHISRYVASNGADGHMMTFATATNPSGAVPTLLLTTTGRRSGEKFVFPLIYGTSGDGYVVVASKGGAPEHPGWYRNLVADPVVDVQVASKRLRATARTATGDERTKLWSQMVALFAPYADYQKKAAGREIPVVVLDPLPAR